MHIPPAVTSRRAGHDRGCAAPGASRLTAVRLLGLLLLALLCLVGYRLTVKAISLRLIEEHNVALAAAVARELAAEYHSLFDDGLRVAGTDHIAAAVTPANEIRLHALLQDAHVHYFDVHDLSGLAIYTSHSDRVGCSHADDPHFTAALDGMVTNFLDHHPADMVGIPDTHVHLVTFAPISSPQQDRSLGVLGLYALVDPGALPPTLVQPLIAGAFALPPLALMVLGGIRTYRRVRVGLSFTGGRPDAAHGDEARCFHTITVQETERKRISRDLHDGISQYLNAIKIHLQHIATDRDERLPPDTRQELEGIVRFVTSASDEVRRISLALRPTMLDDLGLLATLNWLCREFANGHPDITLEKHVTVTEQDIPDRLKTPIYRILQEALTNAAKHSRASWVDVVLEKRTEANGPVLVLTVADDGDGFDLAEVQCRRRGDGGLGLCSMRERAEFDGGSLRIRSERKAGTRIEASWPSG